MKDQLLKGTMILTIAGFATRVIGFCYRIFLAGELGEVNLGIYQLIFPVYSICFTIYAAGIQTAVSQLISHQPQNYTFSLSGSHFVVWPFFFPHSNCTFFFRCR